jgi:hypothetical protein
MRHYTCGETDCFASEALSIADRYAATFNCSNSDVSAQLECMRKVDAAALIGCQFCSSRTNQFIPFIDGKQITDQLPFLFTSGQYNKVPVLIGSNSQEGNIFAFLLSNRSLDMSLDQYNAANDQFFAPHGLALAGTTWYSTFYQVCDWSGCLRRHQCGVPKGGLCNAEQGLLSYIWQFTVGLYGHLLCTIDCKLDCATTSTTGISVRVCTCA